MFSFNHGVLSVLLKKDTAGNEIWHLPGVAINKGDDLDEAADRVLHKFTLERGGYKRQLFTISSGSLLVNGEGISVVYMALLQELDNIDATKQVAWFDVLTLPALTSESEWIILKAVAQMQDFLKREPIGFELLPKKFTLTQLQHLYESVMQRQYDTRNFRKKLMKMEVLTELGEMQENVAHRAARLYTFDKDRYRELKEAGFEFAI